MIASPAKKQLDGAEWLVLVIIKRLVLARVVARVLIVACKQVLSGGEVLNG